MINNYGVSPLLHYLDDFFLVGPPDSPLCGTSLNLFIQVAARLGTVVAPEKVEGPITTLDFLGLTLDSVKQEIRLPPNKLQEVLDELELRTKASKRQLLSLIGRLSFAAKAVPAGRLFLRRLIALSTTISHKHHRFRLTAKALGGGSPSFLHGMAQHPGRVHHSMLPHRYETLLKLLPPAWVTSLTCHQA